MIIVLPELLQDAWARALPGREAVAQNEMLRAFQPCPPSGKHRRMTESDPNRPSGPL